MHFAGRGEAVAGQNFSCPADLWFVQQIVKVSIFVHSCRTGIVRTISLSLSLLFSFFRVLSLCLYSSTYTENKTKSNETIILSSLFLSLSLFSLFNQSTSTLNIFLEFALPLGYKKRCLPIQTSFPFSNFLILARIELFH